MNVRYGRQTRVFEKPMIVRDILAAMRIVPEGVIVAVNGSLVTSDTRVALDAEVDIIRAISGG